MTERKSCAGVAPARWRGRRGWRVANDRVAVTVLAGGGHIAGLELKERPGVNPLWSPVWRSIEPWDYRAGMAAAYGGSKLLAAICGHNLCLGCFGGPSESEGRAGMQCHGEAPVARWRAADRRVTRAGVRFTYGCDLPLSGMRFSRTLLLRPGSTVVRVRETLRSTCRRDQPFTMAQHVTFGPPFLQKGVTVFDMPATRCHTYPVEFGAWQRLKTDTPFRWPEGPGSDGRGVDMRTIGRGGRASSDFSTQLMDAKREHAWLSAVNPALGLLVAYVWRREDFPWVGNWEENCGRRQKPWDGRSLTRGMEFANAPFPMELRKQVDLGRFMGLRAFRWLPALETLSFAYSIVLLPVSRECRGVADIEPSGAGFRVSEVV